MREKVEREHRMIPASLCPEVPGENKQIPGSVLEFLGEKHLVTRIIQCFSDGSLYTDHLGVLFQWLLLLLQEAWGNAEGSAFLASWFRPYLSARLEEMGL